MKQLFDLLPIVAFVAAYFVFDQDIILATKVLVVTSVAHFALVWWLNKQVETVHWVNLSLSIVLGTTTILLRDPVFLYWKPTVLYWLFALILLGSHWFGEKSVFERLLSNQLPNIDGGIWKKISYSIAVLFIVYGIVNLYVAYNYEQSFWVVFKLVSALVLTVLMIAVMIGFLYPHLKEADSDNASLNGSDPENQ